jgi:hypothetical protein
VNVFIRRIKFTINMQQIDLENSTKVGAYKTWRSLWRTGHYSVPQVAALANWPFSGFLRATPLKFIALSGVPPDCPVSQRSNGQLRPTVDCADDGTINRAEVKTSKSECTRLSGVPPDYPVSQEDRRPQRSTAPNPNGWLMWHSLDSEQCYVRCNTVMSSVPIDSQLANG